MADTPTRTCTRCAATYNPALHACPVCGLVRDLGELADPRDRADPDSWGHMG